MAAISIVLKAVDQYSSTITGLNQGFELVGKTIGALTDIASAVWSGIKAGASAVIDTFKEVADLAQLGGAFDEQRNQFENLANSYGLIGQDIIKAVKETSGNTITEFQSIGVATRAVAAGLKGPELQDALSYIKKWSEATGESFTDVSEKVFTALSSGRYAVLRQMGLVIEKGATLTDVTKQMTEGLKRFGETGFNSADKMDALNASAEDFTRKIGQAINRSDTFAIVLGGLSDLFVELVNAFNPKPITVFFDVFSAVFASILGTVGRALPYFADVSAFISDLFKASADDMQAMTLTVGKFMFDIIRQVVGGFNYIADILEKSGIITLVEFIVSSSLQLVSFGVSTITRIVGGLVSTVIDGFGNIIAIVSRVAKAFPDLAAEIGLSADSLSQMSTAFKNASAGIDTLSTKFADGADVVGDFSSELTSGFADALKNTRFDLSEIDDAEADLERRIKEIDFSEAWSKASTGSGINIPTVDLSAKVAIDSASLDKQFDLKTKEIELAKLDKEKVAEQWKNINWPSQFLALGEFIFNYALAKAAEEDVPMAIITAG